MDSRKYIDRMEEAYVQYFKTKLVQQQHRSPLQKGDHPELDTYLFLNDEEKEICQSLVGSNQWSISIGRFDIQSEIMTISKFRSASRRGHLVRMKRIYGYLCKY